MSPLIATKLLLNQELHSILSDKIKLLNSQLESIISSKLNETKSSAGDKYETGRAMMQMEQDKIEAQMAKVNFDLTLIQEIRNRECPSVELGSLVHTNQGMFYFSIPHGKILINGEKYFCLSMNSPLAQNIIEKKIGEQIVFNQKTFKIIELC